MRFYYLLICLVTFPICSLAADEATETARKQTEALLLDPNSPANEQSKQVSSDPEEQKRINALAADVFNKLVEQSEGDPDKMMKIVESAQRDPASFANGFTPEQKKQLEDISNSLGKSEKTH